jgi:hypothetical protein
MLFRAVGGFKEWVDGWAEGKTKGFIKTKSLGWMGGWQDGSKIKGGAR